MQLAHESLLRYQGLHGTEGLCHVRVYEQAGRLPVVIAGALDDSPGTSITNAIEMVAAAVREEFFADCREFALIEHYPDSITGYGPPSFSRVRFRHRGVEENPDDPAHYAGTVVLTDGDAVQLDRREPILGDFRDPRWKPVKDIGRLVGCDVELWTPGLYTARAVAGAEGQRLRDEVAELSAAAIERLVEALEPAS